ncbi:hypothetical protein FKM82_013528 [Ascaphus truei]
MAKRLLWGLLKPFTLCEITVSSLPIGAFWISLCDGGLCVDLGSSRFLLVLRVPDAFTCSSGLCAGGTRGYINGEHREDNNTKTNRTFGVPPGLSPRGHLNCPFWGSGLGLSCSGLIS